MDAGVDFSDQKNLLVAGTSLIAATGLGLKGVTVHGMNIAGDRIWNGAGGGTESRIFGGETGRS